MVLSGGFFFFFFSLQPFSARESIYYVMKTNGGGSVSLAKIKGGRGFLSKIFANILISIIVNMLNVILGTFFFKCID